MIHELKILPESERPGPPRAPVDEVPPGFDLSYDPRHSRQHVLVDGFGRLHTYLRISLVEQCNLRCRYCMPEEDLDWTPESGLLTVPEIIRLASLFVQQGVNKIRLTGGEPLLHREVEHISAEIGRLPGLHTLAITTNGLLLPKKLKRLKEAGVGLFNISLDTLQPDRFHEITQRRGLNLVLRAVEETLRQGYARVKVNCVAMRGFNEDELVDFVEWTRECPIEVRFMEFMPFDGNKWDVQRLIPYQEMLDIIQHTYPLKRLADGPHDTSKKYRVPGFAGTVGFITSMTEHFCRGCNRLRITADGNLKVCLFGPAEVSLRDAMRKGASDEELLKIISDAVGRKYAQHAGMYKIAATNNRPMITIGG